MCLRSSPLGRPDPACESYHRKHCYFLLHKKYCFTDQLKTQLLKTTTVAFAHFSVRQEPIQGVAGWLSASACCLRPQLAGSKDCRLRPGSAEASVSGPPFWLLAEAQFSFPCSPRAWSTPQWSQSSGGAFPKDKATFKACQASACPTLANVPLAGARLQATLGPVWEVTAQRRGCQEGWFVWGHWYNWLPLAG